MALFDLIAFDSGVQIVGKLQNRAGSTISTRSGNTSRIVRFLKRLLGMRPPGARISSHWNEAKPIWFH